MAASAATASATDTTPENRRARYLVAVTSGLRDGEIAALSWADLDGDAGTVNVDKSLAEKGADGWATLGKVKTKGSKRVLPLHPLAARALARMEGGRLGTPGRPPAQADRSRLPKRPGRGASARLRGSPASRPCAAKLPTLFQGKHPIDFHSLRRSFYTVASSCRC